MDSYFFLTLTFYSLAGTLFLLGFVFESLYERGFSELAIASTLCATVPLIVTIWGY